MPNAYTRIPDVVWPYAKLSHGVCTYAPLGEPQVWTALCAFESLFRDVPYVTRAPRGLVAGPITCLVCLGLIDRLPIVVPAAYWRVGGRA